MNVQKQGEKAPRAISKLRGGQLTHGESPGKPRNARNRQTRGLTKGRFPGAFLGLLTFATVLKTSYHILLTLFACSFGGVELGREENTQNFPFFSFFTHNSMSAFANNSPNPFQSIQSASNAPTPCLALVGKGKHEAQLKGKGFSMDNATGFLACMKRIGVPVLASPHVGVSIISPSF